MKHRKFSTLTIGCLFFMLLNSELALSTDSVRRESSSVRINLPSYYPSHFHKLGKLTEIRGQYDWVVNGTAVKVSSNVIVHSLVTNFSSLFSIKQGMELGYRKNSQGEIMEVWQLPAGSIKLD